MLTILTTITAVLAILTVSSISALVIIFIFKEIGITIPRIGSAVVMGAIMWGLAALVMCIQ